MRPIIRLTNALVQLTLLAIILLQAETMLTAQGLPSTTETADEFLREIIDIKRIDVADDADALRKLRVAQHNAARDEVQQVYEQLQEGNATIRQLFDAGSRLLDTQLVLAESQQQRLAVLEQALNFVQRFERRLEAQLERGYGSASGLARAKYTRLEIEIELLEEQQRVQ